MMSNARLNVAVWSAALWMFGWAMHDEITSTGRVNPVSVLIVFMTWLHVNVEAARV